MRAIRLPTNLPEREIWFDSTLTQMEGNDSFKARPDLKHVPLRVYLFDGRAKRLDQTPIPPRSACSVSV